MEHGQGLALPGAERGRNLMKAERWQQVNDLFQSATERAPEERASFLDEGCHGDEGLRREVESLLASYERAENFIESPAFAIAPELLPDSLTADETQLSRFKTEARSASALNHPNILTVYEIGAEGNRQFIATEFIEGMTLRASL